MFKSKKIMLNKINNFKNNGFINLGPIGLSKTEIDQLSELCIKFLINSEMKQ